MSTKFKASIRNRLLLYLPLLLLFISVAESVKSKNIDQNDKNSILELMAIDLFKVGENFD